MQFLKNLVLILISTISYLILGFYAYTLLPPPFNLALSITAGIITIFVIAYLLVSSKSETTTAEELPTPEPETPEQPEPQILPAEIQIETEPQEKTISPEPKIPTIEPIPTNEVTPSQSETTNILTETQVQKDLSDLNFTPIMPELKETTPQTTPIEPAPTTDTTPQPLPQTPTDQPPTNSIQLT